MISVFTVRYIPDMMRNEPKNIGVILIDPENPDDFASKFRGQTDEPHKYRQVLRIPPQVLRRWVEYFEYKVQNGQLQDVWRAQAKRPSQFTLQASHENFSGTSAAELVDEVYSEIVVPNTPPRERLKDKAQLVIERSGVNVSLDYMQEVDLAAGSFEVDFDFAFESESGLAVMEVLSFSQGGRGSAKRTANDFAFRASTLLDNKFVTKTAAFLDLSELEKLKGTSVDQLLRPIESFGTVLDLSDIDRSAAVLAELVAS